jgi:hypothetical protein
MPTTPATADTAARTVEEQFLDLICNDADLLTAEFDAIIAAEWPNPPVNPPGRGPTGRQPTRPAARRLMTRVRRTVSRPRHPGTGGWARQRSPPFQPRTDRKAGDRHT